VKAAPWQHRYDEVFSAGSHIRNDGVLSLRDEQAEAVGIDGDVRAAI
jgi:hypothetical protein